MTISMSSLMIKAVSRSEPITNSATPSKAPSARIAWYDFQKALSANSFISDATKYRRLFFRKAINPIMPTPAQNSATQLPTGIYLNK